MFTFPCTLYALASETTGDVFGEVVPVSVEIPMGIDCGDSDSLEVEPGDWEDPDLLMTLARPLMIATSSGNSDSSTAGCGPRPF